MLETWSRGRISGFWGGTHSSHMCCLHIRTGSAVECWKCCVVDSTSLKSSRQRVDSTSQLAVLSQVRWNINWTSLTINLRLYSEADVSWLDTAYNVYLLVLDTSLTFVLRTHTFQISSPTKYLTETVLLLFFCSTFVRLEFSHVTHIVYTEKGLTLFFSINKLTWSLNLSLGSH